MYSGEVWLYCLAYIIGLLIASGWPQYGLTIFVVLTITSFLLWKGVPTQARLRVDWKRSLVMLVIAGIAISYFQLRYPNPSVNEISHIIPPQDNGIRVTLTGKILNSPTLNRNDKLRFWLSTQRVKGHPNAKGKLYTTVSTEVKQGLTSGSRIQIQGYLYQPQPPKNPGQFDFKQYLQRNGAFAGISGQQVTVIEKKSWGWWRLRERIIKVHRQALGSVEGSIVSAMVLGRKAVDLPLALQEQFLKGGLAHILAASGFHVSLLLGVVLAVTQRLTIPIRFTVGVLVLLLYVGLTGLQPSVLRASLMGIAGLIGLLTDRKVNSVASLLIIATILLFINPLWVINLGFQFSFIATLGLIVTLPLLLTRWDFLPKTIAPVIAVPIAVFPWIFPLQLFHFGTIATYSVVLNVIVTLLAIPIILGGMISGAVGLIIPTVGSVIAQILFYPTQLLIELVRMVTSLPGSYFFFGTIALWQLLGVYGLIGWLWFSKKGWKLMTVGAIALLIVPIIYQQLTLQRITVLATNQQAVVMIQNQGETTLINTGTTETIENILIPFLREEGITKINHAIALHPQSQWEQLSQQIPIKHLYNSARFKDLPKLSRQQIPSQQPLTAHHDLSNDLKIQKPYPMLLEVGFQDQRWGILTHPKQIVPNLSSQLQGMDILLWQGNEIAASWLRQLKPGSAIAVANQLSDPLPLTPSQVYVTGKQGAIQWMPRRGLITRFN